MFCSALCFVFVILSNHKQHQLPSSMVPEACITTLGTVAVEFLLPTLKRHGSLPPALDEEVADLWQLLLLRVLKSLPHFPALKAEFCHPGLFARAKASHANIRRSGAHSEDSQACLVWLSQLLEQMSSQK